MGPTNQTMPRRRVPRAATSNGAGSITNPVLPVGPRETAIADQRRARLRDELIASHMAMAARLAGSFAGRGQDADDLTQVAMLELIKAASRFDPARGATFAQYATPCILGGLKRHFRDTGWKLRVRRRTQDLYLLTNRAIPALTQRLGRTPTIRELATHLHLSEEDTREGINSRLAYRTFSLDLPVIDNDEPQIGYMLGDRDEYLEAVPDRQTLAAHVASLPAREQRILHLRFFGDLSQREIAEQLGISQMHVSRLLAKTMDLLRQRILAQQ
jgi:RNA polymerase sigma-B factor